MRGQMEIMGLVVIIVLFIFGGLIYLFFISGPQDTTLPEVRESAEVSNLLNAIMKMTPCNTTTATLYDIVHDCFLANGNMDVCAKGCKDFINMTFSGVFKVYSPSGQFEYTIKEVSKPDFLKGGSCTFNRRMAAETNVKIGSKSIKVGLLGCYA
jgi:hypothetical protein